VPTKIEAVNSLEPPRSMYKTIKIIIRN